MKSRTEEWPYEDIVNLTHHLETLPYLCLDFSAYIRDLGKYLFLEVLDKLDSYGFDTSAARAACNCEGIKE